MAVSDVWLIQALALGTQDLYKPYITRCHVNVTVNREIFVFKNLRVINFRVKKSSSASGSDEDFLTTKFF